MEQPPSYIQLAVAERRVRCELIAAKVRAKGFDCDWQTVNRHFGWFKRWDEGGLAFGYVIGRTGIRRTQTEGK